MELRERQQQVAKFINEHDLDRGSMVWMLDLVSEVGELSDELLQDSEYGETPLHAGREWMEELGDVLFSLTCLANQTGVDLDDALERALGKYQRRVEDTGELGSGPAR